MSNQELLQDAEQYVRQIFSTRVDQAFTYHSIGHTEGVVAAANSMADYYQLPEEEKLALLLAAWFHDTGYSHGKAKDHEANSQRIATAYLEERNTPAHLIEKITHAIGATRMPQSPSNLTEQILCDADLYHLGTEEFAGQHKLLRRELETLTGEDISKKDWRKNNIRFLQEHQFFTDYARSILEPVKQQHLLALLDKDNGKKNKNAKEEKEEFLPIAPMTKKKNNEPPAEEPAPAPPPAEKIKKDKEKESRTERGIATMFRIMSDNHVSLSQMADSKANIMISVNTIVLSILVSVLFSKLQYYPQFIIPTIILCTVSLCAIIFAILATRPNVNKGTFSHEDVQQKKINLLFFGNFFKMDLPDYEWGMKEMMNDREYLYGSMIKDIYFLGKVLAKKYKFLRISYNIFMYGLVLAIIAFIIAFVVTAD
jgi:predicted metal-dependent HD superfamily phosphohydrolase